MALSDGWFKLNVNGAAKVAEGFGRVGGVIQGRDRVFRVVGA